MKTGYFQEPAIHGKQLVFRADDDLWTFSLDNQRACLLTQSRGIPQNPRISPDGRWIAFTSTDEGVPEIYVMPLNGGSMKRLTYSGSPGARTLGWTPDSQSVIFNSVSGSPFRSLNLIFRVDLEGGHPVNMKVGYGSCLSFGPRGGMVLGRFGREPAHWKRYKGGRAGEVWIDIEGNGQFHRLLEIDSNIAYPMWIADRIYFVGDHDGIGNIYSCDIEGKEITRHTFSNDYYVRNPQTDGESIVYQMGADIYRLSTTDHKSEKLEIELPSSFRQLRTKMPILKKHLETIDIHPSNCSCLAVSRGRLFHFSHWQGGVQTYGDRSGRVRYRLSRWLNDGDRFVAVTDESGEEELCIFSKDPLVRPIVLKNIPVGRINRMRIVPGSDVLIVTNNHEEIIEVELDTGKYCLLDRSQYQRMSDFDISADGRWVAYSCSIDPHRVAIKIFDRHNRSTHIASNPVLLDREPVFDPQGRYLYFLSWRVFDPVRDNLDFNYGFPKGIIPMAITLKADLLNPFNPKPESPSETSDDKSEASKSAPEDTSRADITAATPVTIDLEGIRERAIAMPVPDGLYLGIHATKDRVWLLERNIEGALSRQKSTEKPQGLRLGFFNLKSLTVEPYAENVFDIAFSHDGKVLAYRTSDGLRVLDATKTPLKNDSPAFNKQSGWVDLTRLKSTLDPKSEWLQMYRESWRLMRDEYFAEDLSGVDWNLMYERYLPLVKRCSTRSELSDVIWECYGELGTSHSYEIGGEYEEHPDFSQGMLGIDLQYDSGSDRYIITHIVKGDTWDPAMNSPLNQPGVKAKAGDYLIAVNGQPVSWNVPPGQLLLGMSGQEVILTLSDGHSNWDISVKTIGNEIPARLREWVNKTTEYVHRKTDDRVGYLYIQDMGTNGFAQFHRSWLAESHRDAMIIDVRNNAGGHVSSLLLEKLSRKRLGYCAARHSPITPVPTFCARGPLVALCDEYSGSDGDLFAHKFKMMKLGTLIGRRTWGGVVGIAPQQALVDGTVVTQPEFYHWFDDVGWNLENRGAVPDIIVDVKPHHVANGDDPQLEHAITHIIRELELNPLVEPDLGLHPRRSYQL
ncbi:PDZ domain-containing protein [bacterium]|nr:PDZ domain-containing protein [candidate division CSSED10-310 bacterium]